LALNAWECQRGPRQDKREGEGVKAGSVALGPARTGLTKRRARLGSATLSSDRQTSGADD